MSSNFKQLEEALGYSFKQQALLVRALTHRSFNSDHNERLEFLGDSVLNCAASILLFDEHPNLDEGKLSRVRSHLVKQDCLALIGRRIHLEGYIRLGTGELRSSPVIKDSIVADAMEAVIGAMLIDSDFNTTRDCVIGLLKPVLETTPIESMGKDPKTRLQEKLQARRLKLPTYTVLVEGGTSSSPEFVVECLASDVQLTAQGRGHSRRLAEQQAAQSLLTDLLEQEYSDPNLRKGRSL
ncbi:MAG: ribonuclease III [Limnobacter sp.]|nr:ribonuclease III [Limnobacter sp.]